MHASAKATPPKVNAKEICPAAEMRGAERKELALRLLADAPSVSTLAAERGVSRKFLYQQARKAQVTLDAAFADKQDDEEVLCYIPVTRQWLKQVILGLVLICHASFRGVVEFMRDLLGVELSIGTVHNVMMDAVKRARDLNAAERLANVKVGAHDEIFQTHEPVLVGADVVSMYCYLLSLENSRDAETWAIRLMQLSDKSLRPDYTIADGGKCLRAGQSLAWPAVPCRGDVFHALLEIGRLALYLEHRALGAMAALENTQARMARAKRNGNGNQFSKRLSLAVKAEREAIELADDIATLAEWLRRDILSLAGDDFNSRRELMDFAIEALRQREHLRPHRIRPVRIMLEHQREQLLAFAAETDRKLAGLALELDIPATDLRELFNAIALAPEHDASASQPIKLQDRLGVVFHLAESAVREIIEQTVRASSVIENLNSRLRCYFFLRRLIGPEYLDLLRFFLNHRRFMRSEHPERVGKSPAELLFGQSHPHWLELLGYKPYKRAA